MDENLQAAVAEYQRNIECADALKKLIDNNYDGYRLDSDKVLAAAMNVFGEKRVELALASSINQLSTDGRISRENKDWAQIIMIPQDEYNRSIRVDVHAGLLDQTAGKFREIQKTIVEESKRVEAAVKPLVEKPGVFFQEERAPAPDYPVVLYFNTDNAAVADALKKAIESEAEVNITIFRGGAASVSVRVETKESRADEIKRLAEAQGAEFGSEHGVFQVITYDESIGSDEKTDYRTLKAAIAEAKMYSDGYFDEYANTTIKSDGAAVFNLESKKIEQTFGYFPSERIFSEEVLKINGYPVEQKQAYNAPDRTFAYDIGHSAPFTVVHLDISTEERKNALSEALKDIIDAYTDANGRTLDTAQPYKNLLEHITPEAEFVSASQGHLSCLKYALGNASESKELCAAMLDGIRRAEKNLTPIVTIRGYECFPTDNWEEHGVNYSIGQSVDDMSFYYARATDGNVTRDYKYDYKPDREKVMSDHADNLQPPQKSAELDNNFKHGTVCDYNFYAVRLKGGHKYVNNLSFAQAQEEFSKMCAETPDSLIALGVSYKNAPPLAEYNYAKHTTMGGVDLLQYRSGEYIPVEDYKKDHALSKEPGIAEAAELLRQKYVARTVENAKQAEHVPQPRDGSHITTNASPTATRAESRGNIMDVVKIAETAYSADGLINYCEKLKDVHEQTLKNTVVGNMMPYEEGFINAMNTGAKLAQQLKNEIEGNDGEKITINALVDAFSKQSSKEFVENEPSQFNYGYSTAMGLCLNYARELKAVLEKERQAESRGNIMDNKVTIFEMSKLDFDGVERGHAYIGDFSINELLKAANSEHPFDELMKLGKTGREFWDDYEYVSFEQSNRFTASLTLDLYRSEGRYYEVNDGKGGFDEEHREGKCRFVRGKISELGEKIAEAIEMRGKAPGKATLTQTVENAKQAEPVPQPRDGSHITTNAALTAKRAESRGKIMEQNTTKFEMSTISKLEGDGAKAIGTLVVNGEFAVHGVKVVESERVGENGEPEKYLHVAMPGEKKNNGEWKDTVFPKTKEAYAALNSAVLDTYEKLMASPAEALEDGITLRTKIAAPEKPVSKVYAEMHKVESETTKTKAAGRVTIDDALVITGVLVSEGTNAQGQKKNYITMPSKMDENGDYKDTAHPITADMHKKIDKAVIASVNNIGRYEYKGGVYFAELGENPAQSKPLHPKFADKLMAQLDAAGITYHAKCAEKVVISVKAADKPKFDAAQKELNEKLSPDKHKKQQKQEQTTGTQTQKR